MHYLPIAFLLTLSLYADNLKLRFGTQDFPPYHYYQDDKVAGPVVNVITAVCQEMSAECSFVIHPWRRTQNMAELGHLDGIFVLGKTKERETWLAFSHPMVSAEYGFFVERSDPLLYKSPEDMRGLNIAVYGPSNTEKSLQEIRRSLNGELKIDMRPDDESGFKKLSRKRVDAVYSNKHVGKALIYKLNLENIRYAGKSKTVKYYVGFVKSQKGNSHAALFNKAYEKLYENGTVQRILAEHFMPVTQIR